MFFFLSQVYAVHTPLHASQGVFCGEISSLRLLSSALPFGPQNGLSIYLFPRRTVRVRRVTALAPPLSLGLHKTTAKPSQVSDQLALEVSP